MSITQLGYVAFGVRDIEAWSEEPDYGICIQTRRVRGFDIDVPNKKHELRPGMSANGRCGSTPARSSWWCR